MKRRLINVHLYYVLIGIFLAFIMTCCQDEISEPEIELPIVKTLEISDIMYNGVTVASSIVSNGGDSITERGICWSKESNPTISDFSKENVKNDSNVFFIQLENLESNILYYVRSYAVNEKGLSYGEELTFTLWLNKPEDPISDIDNNSYSTIRIGDQVWMKENLKVTHYRNGDPIDYLPSENDLEWINTESGAYCSYEDDQANAEKYGYLYNGFVVADQRNICPEGWHVPTVEDWRILFNYLGGRSTELSGSLLRSEQGWKLYLPNNYTNLSGFSALPGGIRTQNADKTNTNYWHISDQAYFATPDVEYNPVRDKVWFATVLKWAEVYPTNIPNSGVSIRCIKD